MENQENQNELSNQTVKQSFNTPSASTWSKNAARALKEAGLMNPEGISAPGKANYIPC